MSNPFPLPNGLPGAFNPVINSATSIFQVGSYNALTDAFSLELDLNDFVNYWIEFDSMKMPQPPKVYNRSFNPRTPGEAISHVQYKNRHIQVSVRLKGATTQAILNAIRVLLEAIENPPYTLRIALPNATQYTYADVVAVAHNIPTDPQALKALIIPSIQISFECKPGFRGDRQYIQNLVFNPGFEAPSGPGIQAFNDSFANLNAYVVQAGSAPSLAANVMTIPNGTRVSFGSPAWGAVQNWLIRWKWVTGLTATFYPHYADASDFYSVVVNGSTLQLTNEFQGGSFNDGSTAAALTNGTQYWLQVVHFPGLPQVGNPTGNYYITASIYSDSAGALGTLISTVSKATQLSFSAAAPQIQAAGAALAVGGAFSNVHTVSLFGPGAWSLLNGQGGATGLVSLAWDGSNVPVGMSGIGGANTYPGGPVNSFGCARLDMPPAGTVGALLFGYSGGSPTGSYAMPVAAGTDVLSYSVWVKSSGLSSSAVIALQGSQFTSSGSSISTSTIQSVTGNQGSWTQLSGTLTTASNCAFAGLYVKITDSTTGSANGTLWVDNVLCWDVTATGMATMAYNETRFPQSPAQLVTSGLEGDMAAPAIVMMGGYFAALNTGHSARAYLGRRAISTASMSMVAATVGGSDSLDFTAYGGYTLLANLGPFRISPKTETGTYHLFGRAQTANGSPAGVTINGEVYTQLASNGNVIGSVLGPTIQPFQVANTWTTVDTSQVVLPPSPLGTLVDPTKVATYVSTTSGGSGGSQLTVNAIWLMPVDGELFLGQATNPATVSINLTTSWAFIYWDGIAAATTYSVESSPLAAPAHSTANYYGSATGSGTTVMLNVVPNGDTLPMVDPTIGTSLAAGVNQYVLHMTDDAATVLPIAVDIVYSPLYLYPR